MSSSVTIPAVPPYSSATRWRCLSQLPQLAQQRAEVLVSGTSGADAARAAIGSLGLLRSPA